jgi:nucleoside-diphosphate-sugar epimerase
MKILLTGKSGFVGENLQESLASKYSVERLSMRSQDTIHIKEGILSVIHLAGKAHDTVNVSDPKEYFEVNTELTTILFDQFVKSTARDFIYFSSVKACADTVDGILTEETVPNPLTPYGQSKMQAELYLLRKALPAGKRVFILRPCMIHGPGNKGNLNLLYQIVKKGFPWPLAAFENQRSFLSISNLNYVIRNILDNASIPGGIYQLADDQALSTNQLISLISESEGKNAKLWNLNSGFVRSLARFGDILSLPLNSERLKKLTESYRVDNSKIKDALGIKQFPVSSREGLLITLKSFKN